MLSEIHRVLSPNGVYICVSYGVKENRQKYFTSKDFDWTVFHHMVAKPTISTSTLVAQENKDDKNFHWVYIMRKQGHLRNIRHMHDERVVGRASFGFENQTHGLSVQGISGQTVHRFGGQADQAAL
jgi:ubiquinone/menaquinone biosynthesis C-methylase UbiE